VNKNSVYGDVSAVSPGGLRVGAAALTSRSFLEADFVRVAEFLHRAVQLALAVQAKTGKPLKDFVVALENHPDIAALRHDVEAFAATFPMPGFDTAGL
jgi:glycine hydroxymethyltransferase